MPPMQPARDRPAPVPGLQLLERRPAAPPRLPPRLPWRERLGRWLDRWLTR